MIPTNLAQQLLQCAQLLLSIAEQQGAVRPAATLTVNELLDEFLATKARTGRSQRYLWSVRTSVARLLGDFRERKVVDVKAADVEAALAGLPVAARTARTYFTDVRILFNFAVRREYLARNPLLSIEVPSFLPKPPALHSPDEVRAVLKVAFERDRAMGRSLAVRYFAGVRAAELQRMSEANLLDGYVEIPAEKSKTRRRRLVSISPNLRAWLDTGGTLRTGRMSGELAEVARRAGVPWPGNVTRHSFCSYHLAHFGNAGRTALEAGHSEQMLFAHYREVTTKEAAREFWEVGP